MLMPLKRKYTCRSEPRAWHNVAGKKNTPQYGSGPGLNTKRHIPKGVPHPVGFSGRSLAMRRRPARSMGRY